MADEELKKGQIKIVSNGDELIFSPASLRQGITSGVAPNSGRTMDGENKIKWLFRAVTKLEIQLPPYSLDDEIYMAIVSMVQGQEYSLKYWDTMANDWVTDDFYTADTATDWYSGVIYNGLIQGCSFNAIGMHSKYKVDANHPVAPIPPHNVTPKPTLTTPVISLTNTTVSWAGVTHATTYVVNDNGTETTQSTTTYTITDDTIVHIIKVKAKATGYKDSNYSNSVSYVPVAPAEYWLITWKNVMIRDETAEEAEIWSVCGQHLPDSTTFTTVDDPDTVYHDMPVDSEGNIYYNTDTGYVYQTHVYDYEPNQGVWIDDTYKTIKMYDDPNTIFIDSDWANFFAVNKLTVQHFNG